MASSNYIVKINSKCNLNCCFCADDLIARSQPDFDYEALITGLEHNRKAHDDLIISGGEPTIYPKLLNYIRHAKQVCKYKRISLTTNAALLYSKENAIKLIENGVDSFLVSFSHGEGALFDAIVKKEGTFLRVVKGIRNVKELGKEVRINAVVHKLNYKKLPQIVRFFISLGVDAIQLSYINPVGTSVVGAKSFLAIPYNEAMPFIEQSFDAAHELNFTDLYIENIPICAAPKLIAKISDLKKPEENKEYYNRAKYKPSACSRCSFVDICDGPWKAHLEHFGESELHPIGPEFAKKIRLQVLEKGQEIQRPAL
jgi:MoaA/NifB/PqqE/SkfB family radical SAM enzyme